MYARVHPHVYGMCIACIHTQVGCLDATLHLGYPGSTASLAQQAGRAGRGARDALAIVVAADNPLEQSLMEAPAALTERPLDQTVLDPANHVVLRQHLAAAAREHPLRLPPPSVMAAEAAAAAAAAAEAKAEAEAEAKAAACAARNGRKASRREGAAPKTLTLSLTLSLTLAQL